MNTNTAEQLDLPLTADETKLLSEIERDLDGRIEAYEKEALPAVTADGDARFDAWLASQRAHFRSEARAHYETQRPPPSFLMVATHYLRQRIGQDDLRGQTLIRFCEAHEAKQAQ